MRTGWSFMQTVNHCQEVQHPAHLGTASPPVGTFSLCIWSQVQSEAGQRGKKAENLVCLLLFFYHNAIGEQKNPEGHRAYEQEIEQEKN